MGSWYDSLIAAGTAASRVLHTKHQRQGERLTHAEEEAVRRLVREKEQLMMEQFIAGETDKILCTIDTDTGTASPIDLPVWATEKSHRIMGSSEPSRSH